MEEKEIIKLVNEISLKLLGTKKHVDYEWLVELLRKINE
tara:strand:+ start:462 stop:578 length:117 start_codon:yes stop_codon:yes gene_type:complete